MSGFQIPGLGQAKPNETLPPLPADVLAAAASVDATEAPPALSEPHGTSQPKQSDNKTEELNTAGATAALQATGEPDAMIIDQPDSPLSLTGALEAAIGGLDSTDNAPEQPQPQINTVALQNDQSEHPEWEVDSSPYESSSESSSSDSSDEDSDNEGYELLGVEETARLLMEAEGGSDDEGDHGKGSSAARLRTKNEIAEEIVPKPDITITSEMKIEELGSIEHIVENTVLIKAITPGEYQVLDTGSALCTAERAVIGAVAETIGKVLQPMYTVYFSSEQEIKDLALEVGTKVFYPVDHASYVFTQPLRNVKGSDASNFHDEEVGDDEMEFSDDEKEAEYKRALKQKKKDKWRSKNEDKAGGAARGPHPLSQEVSADGGLNYDDDDDGPYKPLARPPGFGDGLASSESYEPAPRPGFRRGRGGDVRGRGSRGRGGAGRGGGRGGYGNTSRDGYSLPPQGGQQNSQQIPNQPATQQAAAPPVMPNFGFQLPAWPQSQAAPGQYPVPPPPPPPGWPAQGQGQAGAPNAIINPAFVAALMSQMQQQNGQHGWGAQQQPPPNGGQAQ
ncbi:Gar1/Naf1 RNA binding domain protein [Metarhizium robertsii]|uniref:H/ACA ribonucleoprotein complex non-core subunit NAF1 n=2 Tax=Metarhizium robertsii TaxID=568076 RepID=E9F276_METRA|nr:Naf1p [Metarhizium robertsii ARSEF 23]EFY98165.1 Naf1p [Metarhizium robertsii ARSEF 23]EXV01542.1 Gar1/Naf1 RNA binding domain protein [Metarhizium robertsii]